MNTFVKYIQNFFALFLLLMVVRQLIPNGRLKKYIYFFTELVFVIGILQPFFLFLVMMLICWIKSGMRLLRKI